MSDAVMEHQVKTDDPVLEQIVRRLIQTYCPLRIYLFGSRAAGTQKSGRDYNILLVVSNDTSNDLKTANAAYRCLWGIRASIDAVVWTEREFDNMLLVENSLPAYVVRKGMLLYAT